MNGLVDEQLSALASYLPRIRVDRHGVATVFKSFDYCRERAQIAQSSRIGQHVLFYCVLCVLSRLITNLSWDLHWPPGQSLSHGPRISHNFTHSDHTVQQLCTRREAVKVFQKMIHKASHLTVETTRCMRRDEAVGRAPQSMIGWQWLGCHNV